MNGVEGFREFMCEWGARSLRLSVWGSRSEWLTEGEGQQTVVEHIQVGKQREKGERFSFKREHFKVKKIQLMLVKREKLKIKHLSGPIIHIYTCH